MAVLSATNRKKLNSQYMSEASAKRALMDFTKTELREAINAIDDWVETNFISFNNAIPVGIRGKLSVAQKIKLLMLIIKRRWEVE